MTRSQTPVTGSPPAQLVPLGESDLTVADGQDIRGMKAFATGGDGIGSIDELLIDPSEAQVRFLRLKGGGVLGIGDSHWLVPVEAVAYVSDTGVHLDLSRERLLQAPRYQPELVAERHLADVYDFYGYPPYWGPGYLYPTMWNGRRHV